jgi:hypothetical protein
MCTSKTVKMLRCFGTYSVSSGNTVCNTLPSVVIQVMYICYIFVPLLTVGYGRNPYVVLV